jgi:alpha-beta hydrolase superfamily lysophospholipase
MSGILLVHGAWHGPWCWENFVTYLSECGHEVRAVRLRGHDRPPARIWHRVRHYVEDLQRAVAEFAEPPVLIGHSLGGLVVQKYLEHNPAPGAVLMASAPPGGTIGAVTRQAVRHPIALLTSNLLLRLRPFTRTSKLVRELFFTPRTPQEIVDHCFARLQDESYLAFIDTMIMLPRPDRIRAPMLVLGAGLDTIFTVSEVQKTARAYRTEAEIFPGMGHDMMLDEGWHKVADRLDAWVRKTASIDTCARTD